MSAPQGEVPKPSSTNDKSSVAGRGPEGLSAFVARVLDQLSISAWLPAALAVAGIYFALQLNLAEGSAADALKAVAGTQWEQLLVLLGGVILLTTVTQAFDFGAIRVLEGYWGTSRPLQALGDRLGGRFEGREKEASRRRIELQLQAFSSAQVDFARAADDIDLVRSAQAQILGIENLPVLTEAQEQDAELLDWRTFASAQTMRRLSEHERQMKEMPRRSRIMPTRLGNVLRASEDRANKLIPGSVEGMVQRTFHLLPAHLQGDTDQFRNRLGLYASLVVTELMLALLSPALLFRAELAPMAALVTTHLALSAVFYRATISSARAYGGLLEEVAEFVSRSGEDALVNDEPARNSLILKK